jgi:hypothetical protein
VQHSCLCTSPASLRSLMWQVDSGMPLWKMPKFATALLLGLVAQCMTYAFVPFLQPFFKVTAPARRAATR